MLTFTDAIMRSLLARSLDTSTIDGDGWRDVSERPGSTEGEFIDGLTIANLEESVVKSGQLVEVPEAMRVGATG